MQYVCSKAEAIFSTVVTTQALLSIYRDKNIFFVFIMLSTLFTCSQSYKDQTFTLCKIQIYNSNLWLQPLDGSHYPHCAGTLLCVNHTDVAKGCGMGHNQTTKSRLSLSI